MTCAYLIRILKYDNLKAFWNFKTMPNENIFCVLCFQSLGKKTGLSGAVASCESSVPFKIPFLSLNFCILIFLSHLIFFFFLFLSPQSFRMLILSLVSVFPDSVSQGPPRCLACCSASPFLLPFCAFCLPGFLLLEGTLSAAYFLFIVLFGFVVTA